MTDRLHSSSDERRYLESFLRTSAEYLDLSVPEYRASGREGIPRTPISRIRVPVRRSSARTMHTQF